MDLLQFARIGAAYMETVMTTAIETSRLTELVALTTACEEQERAYHGRLTAAALHDRESSAWTRVLVCASSTLLCNVSPFLDMLCLLSVTDRTVRRESEHFRRSREWIRGHWGVFCLLLSQFTAEIPQADHGDVVYMQRTPWASFYTRFRPAAGATNRVWHSAFPRQRVPSTSTSD
jgi:hypothetical protein